MRARLRSPGNTHVRRPMTLPPERKSNLKELVKEDVLALKYKSLTESRDRNLDLFSLYYNSELDHN